jgi:hypothetical protein
MIEASEATSNLTILDETFGKLYQSTQKISKAMERLSDLQWEYERTLRSSANALELGANLEE